MKGFTGYKFKNNKVFLEAFITIILYTIAVAYCLLSIALYVEGTMWYLFVVGTIIVAFIHIRTVNQIFKDMKNYKNIEDIKYIG